MGYTVRSGSTITAKVNWSDVNGSAGEIDGPTTWTAADESLVTVEADKNDSTLARVSSVGPLGTTQVIAAAQSKSGKQITAQVDVHVISAEATTGTITMSSTSMVTPYGAPPPPIMPTGGGTLT